MLLELWKKGEWLGPVEWMWHGTRVEGYQKSLFIMKNGLCF